MLGSCSYSYYSYYSYSYSYSYSSYSSYSMSSSSSSYYYYYHSCCCYYYSYYHSCCYYSHCCYQSAALQPLHSPLQCLTPPLLPPRFNARRQRILEERKAQVAAILAKRKAAAETEAQKTRHWRIEHWGAEAKSRRAEAHELSNRTKDDRSMLDLGLQAEDKREDKQRVRDRSVDQVRAAAAAPAPTTTVLLPLLSHWSPCRRLTPPPPHPPQVKGPSVSSETWGLTENLGVFGKPLDVGDFGAAHQGEPQEGVDELQVKVFSEAGQSAAHQDKYRELENVEMELGRSQQLYDALQQEAASMSDAAMNLLVQRGRLDAELGQLGEEHRGLLVVQQTRTDRKLTPAERQATHARKRREADLKARIEAIAHRVEVLQERRRASEQQSLGVARATAVLKVDAKAKKADLDAHNSGLGELPMVVGKHISDVEGGVGKLAGRPVETFNLVTHTSQLEVLRASAKSVRGEKRAAATTAAAAAAAAAATTPAVRCTAQRPVYCITTITTTTPLPLRLTNQLTHPLRLSTRTAWRGTWSTARG